MPFALLREAGRRDWNKGKGRPGPYVPNRLSKSGGGFQLPFSVVTYYT
jgi:hypothetical protein